MLKRYSSPSPEGHPEGHVGPQFVALASFSCHDGVSAASLLESPRGSSWANSTGCLVEHDGLAGLQAHQVHLQPRLRGLRLQRLSAFLNLPICYFVNVRIGQIIVLLI